MQRPEIRHFADYRTFLAAYVRDRKARHPQWSLSVWAKKLSLKSASGITRVLNGERAPSRELTAKLIRYFAFSADEADYFRALIKVADGSHDSVTTAVLVERLAKVHPIRDSRTLDAQADETRALLQRWYAIAICEMVRLTSFREDPAWICAQLGDGVSTGEVRETLRILENLGWLKRDACAKLCPGTARINLPGTERSEAVQAFHAQMLERAAIEQKRHDVSAKDYRGTTLSVRAENVPKLKALISEFHRRAAELIEEDAGDVVYQLQSQLFPLSRPEAAECSAS